MLSQSRSGFLPQVALVVLGVSACAGNSDINTPAGTGGNQSGTPGSAGNSGTPGSAGTNGTAGTTGNGGSPTTGVAGAGRGGGASSAGAAGIGRCGRDRRGRVRAARGGPRRNDGDRRDAAGAAGRRGSAGGRRRGRPRRHDRQRRSERDRRRCGDDRRGRRAAATSIWPNDMSRANSDVARAKPRQDLATAAAGAGDRSRDTVNASTLVDRHIAALDRTPTSFHKYKDTAAQPAVVYQLVKVAKATRARHQLHVVEHAGVRRRNIQLKDPADPSGPNLTLCQLFEKGVINEVWCMASQNPKVRRDAGAEGAFTRRRCARQDVAGDRQRVQRRQHHEPRLQGDDPDHRLQLGARHRLSSARDGSRLGALHGRQRGARAAQAGGALPELGPQHARGRRSELLQRVQQQRLTADRLPRLGFADRGRATVASAASTFDITDMSGGCGNAHFYANTTGTYSYDANTPDPTVLTSCENYGLHNGTGGKDLTTTYTTR